MLGRVCDKIVAMNSIGMFDNTKESLGDLLEQIHTGKAQLPDLQRSFTWCNEQIVKLIASMSQSFPIGAILTIKVNNNSSFTFKPRLLEGVKLKEEPVPDSLILDGQQRLTSAYMCLRSGHAVSIRDRQTHKVQERWYYIDIPAALNPEIERVDAIISLPRSQTQKTKHRKIDCSTAEKEYEQLLFPVSAIFNYAQWREGFQKYWNYEPEKLALARHFELEIVKRFEHYQLPIIQLRPELSKVAVCQIFEDMHEMPTPMTFFDLVTACFAAEDFSLRDHFDGVSKQLSRFGVLQGVRNTDWLSAVTLVATYHHRERVVKEHPLIAQIPTVGCGRQNILDLELADYQQFAPLTLAGFDRAAKFLHGLGFVHPEDIAYPSQLLALASVLAIVGLPNDLGRTQLERWWWLCSLGEVYNNWQNKRTANDTLEIPRWLAGGAIPSNIDSVHFNRARLLQVTRRQGAIYKTLNALLRKQGAIDFLSGEIIRDVKAFDGEIESHHLFPEAWCKQQGIPATRYNCLLNRTPLKKDTNRFIGSQPPSVYLARLVDEQGISKQRLNEILRSHFIEPKTLWSDDFDAFLDSRMGDLSLLIEEMMGIKLSRKNLVGIK
jgi:hypothetical protein